MELLKKKQTDKTPYKMTTQQSLRLVDAEISDFKVSAESVESKQLAFGEELQLTVPPAQHLSTRGAFRQTTPTHNPAWCDFCHYAASPSKQCFCSK